MTEHSPPDDEIGIAGFVEELEFLAWLDLSVIESSDGRVLFELPYKKVLGREVGDPPVVHGGVVATIIDAACGFALRTTFDEPETAELATIDLDVSYLQPGQGSLTVESEVVRAGGSVGVARATVTRTDDGEKVAVGTATYRLFR